MAPTTPTGPYPNFNPEEDLSKDKDGKDKGKKIDPDMYMRLSRIVQYFYGDGPRILTGFGRVYGSKPLGMSDKEWEQIISRIKDAHAVDPGPRPNVELTDDELYEEMKAEVAANKPEKIVHTTMESGKPNEWSEPVKCGYHPVHAKPSTYPEGQAREAIKDEERKFQKTVRAIPPHYDAVRGTVYPHQAIPSHYNTAGYETYDAKIRAELKKLKIHKAISVFCKVFSVICLIYIGLIIMEIILAGKPIATFLHRMLIGE